MPVTHTYYLYRVEGGWVQSENELEMDPKDLSNLPTLKYWQGVGG